MAQSRALNPSIPFGTTQATEHISGVARAARERALAAGLTVTTHKEGQLVQEKMVGGRVIELFSQVREEEDE